MNATDYVNHYENHYRLEGENGAGQLVWKPQFAIWKQAGYKKGMNVLDYGCGVGVMVQCGIAPEDYNGVDISETAIVLARKRYPKYNFVCFTVGQLPSLPSNICVAQSVFTHTPKIMVDLSLQDIKSNFLDFALIDILLGKDNPNDEHVRHFTELEWEDALWRNGLRGERIAEHNFVGYNHVYYRITHD